MSPRWWSLPILGCLASCDAFVPIEKALQQRALAADGPEVLFEWASLEYSELTKLHKCSRLEIVASPEPSSYSMTAHFARPEWRSEAHKESFSATYKPENCALAGLKVYKGRRSSLHSAMIDARPEYNILVHARSILRHGSALEDGRSRNTG
jgi:hypothetical protein